MKYIVEPRKNAQGEITVPGDKSISHRSIMLASIAEGTSQVTGFLEGEDCLATMNVFKNMGVQIECKGQGKLSIHGVGRNGLSLPNKTLDMGNSGTSMRLLSGLLAGQSFETELVGDSSLMKRPMRRVCDPLNQMGANVTTNEDGTPPVLIKPVDHLEAISYELPVASAQVKSAILLAGLYAQGKTTVRESKITRDHTERMLESFSYPLEVEAGYVSVDGGKQLQATDIHVPADISSAAFFIVAACIANKGDITIHNVGMNPTRTGVLDILQQMNANIEIHDQAMMGGEPTASITVQTSQLKGIDVPTHLVPSAIDEFPIICIAAACADGVTRVTNAEELRVKESDRISQVANGLKELNIKVEEFADGLTITGGEFSGGMIESGHDHRVAMAFAVASLRANSNIEITDCQNVATSFPGFVELANLVGLRVNVV
ncbi:MAG: 3-phosphoshikimate 1-carboxyvinyltransferase [Gammaproteobacteria bacterium]|nr:3-phosphoshikimate 1-carboxyvinyltransferase [Gammaproteobacteria bacterium]